MQNVNVILGRVCVVRAFRRGASSGWTVRDYLTGSSKPLALPKTLPVHEVSKRLGDWALIHGDGFDRIDCFEETTGGAEPLSRKAG